MTRRTTTFLAGLAVSAVVALGATAAAAPTKTSDVKGPKCTDVVDDANGVTSAGFYDAETQTVSLRLVLAAPVCKQFKYSVSVYDEAGDTTPLVTSSSYTVSPDASNVIFFRDLSVAANADDTVCLVATTSAGNHVFDRAPDTGCFELTAGEGSAARGLH